MAETRHSEHLAGWYDGVRIRVADDAHSAIASAHEGVHAKIFSETADGQVFRAFIRALQENRVTESDSVAVASSIQTILASSNYAQEVFATYLSLKQFPPCSEKRYFAELTDEYKDYYKALSDIIDPEIPTSYLQFVFGWTLSVIVFSSTLIARTANLTTGVTLVLNSDECPNNRLLKLLDVIKAGNWEAIRSRLYDVATQECDSRGIEPWDFFSEDEWTYRVFDGIKYSADGGYIETAIFNDLREWLRVQLPFALVSEEQLEKSFGDFGSMVEQRFGVQLHDMRTLLMASEVELATASRAISQSYSRVMNSNPMSVPQGDVSLLHDYARWKHIVSFSVYSACPTQNTTDWILCGWDKPPDVCPASFAASYSQEQIVEFLKTWAQRREANEVVPTFAGLVIAVDNVREVFEIIASAPLLIENRQIKDKLAWYLWDGIYEFIQGFVLAGHSIFCGRLDSPDFAEHIGRSSQLEYDGVMAFVGQLDDNRTLGLFVRAMRQQAYSSLGVLQSAWANEGKVNWMTEAMLRDVQPLATEALSAAMTFWEEY